MHRALNQPFIENDFQVDTILQSIKRKLAKVPFQVLPITPKILLDIYQIIDINKPCDLALWCSFLVAFYCLFRKANVAPKSLTSFDPRKDLTRSKIVVFDNSALIYSNFSKTNQFMNRDSVLPLCKHSVQGLDPIYHLRKLFDENPASPDSPAFSYTERNLQKFITYTQFSTRLKSLLDMAGYSPHLYSGHSMHRGGATLLFQKGCDPLLIQAVGDWRTDQFLK